jgi:4-hydroxy-3-polyprenylbenzoate decarboxylase
MKIIEALVSARTRKPIPPVIVDSAPCKENIKLGADVDLTDLPLPMLHVGDGGRYLNTLGIIIARTPDRRWTSWSIARIMFLDERRGTGTVVPFQHIGRVHKAWRDIGQDMPFAIAFGVPPIALYAAGMPLPENVDEGDYAGAFLGEPMDVVKCETVDLEVPAQSEIVLEGHLSITELGLEGPFGEYGGYLHPHYSVPQPVYHVEAMTFQDNPLFPFTCAGEPPEENHTVWGVGTASESVHMLREKGFPITTGWSPFHAANGWLVVTVSDAWREVDADAEEFCRKVGDVVFATKVGTPVNTIIVVEDDIDPSNLRELVWAIDGRRGGGPGRAVPFAGKMGFAMSPYIHPDEFDFPKGWTSTSEVWNLLPPADRVRPPRTRFDENYPAHVRERVLANWESDGFEA